MPGTRSPGVRNCQSDNFKQNHWMMMLMMLMMMLIKDERYKHSRDKLTVASPQNG